MRRILPSVVILLVGLVLLASAPALGQPAARALDRCQKPNPPPRCFTPAPTPTLAPTPVPTPVPTPTPVATPTPTPPTDPLQTPDTIYLHRFSNGLGDFSYDDQWGEQGLVYTSCRNGNGGSHHSRAQSDSVTSTDAAGLHMRLTRTTGNEFNSGIISTKVSDKVFTGGIFEARIKYDKGTGYWPAFWLLARGSGVRDEIDVLEAYPNPTLWPFPNRHETNIHLLTGTDQHQNLVHDAGVDLTTGFHIFSIEWRQGSIKTYLDGVLWRTVTTGIPWQPMYLLFDLKAGSFHTCTDSTTPNGQMIVEWVRVRQ